ncbi:ABC transporter permease [Pseudogracilibacillus auburnensis]|uniref:Putative ABC transport system permease protein n=1 Tax=Pseudogracilibacillus auburnensis TaxID=1494959 RepID=A0A2V3VV60_9BACI|nr:ABC transporter permease [Pseudogracilibacillus auburnensis]PXW85546.1 putative ABC transport system permease protein [Pseudogracilibacillus auburnensis]
MNILESFKIALSSIWNHKIRSILTMLGIIIGVCAVIIIVAIGTGAQTQLTDELFGDDKNVIELYYEPFPTDDGSEMMWVEPELTADDLAEIQQLPGVKVAMGINHGWGTLFHNEKQIELQIVGVGRDYFYGKNIEMVEGRPFTMQDNDNMNRVVMIDDFTRDKLFKEDEDIIGEIVEISGNPYKLVGVYKSTTPPEYRWGDDGEALMPRTLNGMMFGAAEIQQVQVLAASAETLTETADLAATRLSEIKNLEDGEYTYWDMSEYEEEFASFYKIVTLVIGSIAGISLLVGGIGVMNIMLVSVTERTREIGLRKAIGATRKRILFQFLIEAMTITLLGGLIGIGIAMLVTIIVSQFLPFTAVVSPIVVMIGASFSALIGIVFGILPANKASKLSPIDALRHE